MSTQNQPIVDHEVPAGLQADTPEAEFTNQLIAEAIEYIYDKEFDSVTKLLAESKDTPATMGSLAFKVTKGLLDKHKKAGMAMDIEFDVAMGIATEVIDMQIELLDKIQEDKLFDPQRMREDALMRAIVLYGEQFEGDPEAKEAAATMLRGMMMDGTADQAFGYVNRRAKQEGLNINDLKRQGADRVKPVIQKQTELASGIQQGLMDQAAPPEGVG